MLVICADKVNALSLTGLAVVSTEDRLSQEEARSSWDYNTCINIDTIFSRQQKTIHYKELYPAVNTQIKKIFCKY